MGIYERDYMKADYRPKRSDPPRTAVVPLVIGAAMILVLTIVGLRMILRTPVESDETNWIAHDEPIQPLDVNNASSRELDDLPGVTPMVASGIVQMRPFEDIDGLLRVKGVGPKTLAKIRQYLFVGTNEVSDPKIEVEANSIIDPHR
jgi:hypothetical protein